MKIQYKSVDKIEKDYYGDGLKVNCTFENIEYKLFIFSTESLINCEDSLLNIDDELASALSWVKTNEIEIHRDAVEKNYNFLFDDLISDSDYYLEKGDIISDELLKYTHLGWIKVFCEDDKIKSLLFCYIETEETNEAILGGHTFGIEIDEIKN